MRDAVHLHQGSEGELNTPDGDSGWRRVAEGIHIGLVHLAEQGHVANVDVHFCNIVERRTSAFKDFPDVLDRL